MKLGSEGMQMVDNSHLIDPVLLNFLKHANLDPDVLGQDAILKAKDMAEKHGLYEVYEQNASESKKQRDRQRISMLPPPPPGPRVKPPTPGLRGKPPPPGPKRTPPGPPPPLPRGGPPRPVGGAGPPKPVGGAGPGGPPPPPPPPPPADGGAFPPPQGVSSKPPPPRNAKPGAGGLSLADQLKGAPNLKPAPPQGGELQIFSYILACL